MLRVAYRIQAPKSGNSYSRETMPNLRTLAVALALISTAGISGVANAASTTATNPSKTVAASKLKPHADKKGTPGKKTVTGNKATTGLGKKELHADKKKAKDKPAAHHKAAKSEPKKDKHAKDKPKKAAVHARSTSTDKRVARRDHAKN
jgi:hypothetical protein